MAAVGLTLLVTTSYKPELLPANSTLPDFSRVKLQPPQVMGAALDVMRNVAATLETDQGAGIKQEHGLCGAFANPAGYVDPASGAPVLRE